MSRLSWMPPVFRLFNAGVDRCVLYSPGISGVPWNGVVDITETNEYVENVDVVDGISRRQRIKTNPWAATLSAYTYPDEFEKHQGTKSIFSLQRSKSFGLSYRTKQSDNSYLLHMVYNVKAKAIGRDYISKNETSQITPFKWALSTTPIAMPDQLYGSHLIAEVRDTNSQAIIDLESMLYGDSDSNAYLPSPTEILEVFESNASLRVIDNGDGTTTIIGPDEAIIDNGDGTLDISWDSVLYISDSTVQISSL